MAVADGADDAGRRDDGYFRVEGAEMGVMGAVHEPAVGGAAGDEQRVNGAGAAQRDGSGVGGGFDELGAAGGGEQDKKETATQRPKAVMAGRPRGRNQPAGGRGRAAGCQCTRTDRRGRGKPNPERKWLPPLLAPRPKLCLGTPSAKLRFASGP